MLTTLFSNFISAKKISQAELAADRALELARHAVHEARAAVKSLEKQMNDEFQRAQARKMETDGVVKELEKLGRHDHRA